MTDHLRMCFRFELALQQNETLDVFVNDYLNLGEEESGFCAKSDNHLKVSVQNSRDFLENCFLTTLVREN